MKYEVAKLYYPQQWKSFTNVQSVLKNSLKDKEYGTRKRNAKSHCVTCAYNAARHLILINSNSRARGTSVQCRVHQWCTLPQEHQKVKVDPVLACGRHVTDVVVFPHADNTKRCTSHTAMHCLHADVEHLYGSHILRLMYSCTSIVRFYAAGIEWRAV